MLAGMNSSKTALATPSLWQPNLNLIDNFGRIFPIFGALLTAGWAEMFGSPKISEDPAQSHFFITSDKKFSQML
jgi:hypothetical protein